MVSFRRAPGNWWLRLRYQIAGCVMVGAVLPYLLRIALLPPQDVTPALLYTMLASAVAIVLGAWWVRQVGTYPGVEGSAYLLPAFAASYGLALSGLVLGRVDYNRLILLTSFVVTLIWFYVLFFRLQRQRLRIGIVPIGEIAPLRLVDRIDWVTLSDPESPINALDAVTADMRIDLPEEWDRRLADYALAGLPVYHCRHLLESLTGRVELVHLSENNFGSLSPASAYMWMKHLLDWAAAAIALVILSPFLLLLAIFIRLDSPGPAIFRQVRIGYQARPFTVYKFRTMHHRTVPAAALRDSAMTQDADPRVTRIGRFLRHSRIDELPQLVNILRGEMSWIGPRPEADVLSHWYEQEIPFYRYRHIVRPGLTGWAQVMQGHVADVVEVKAKLYYDFFYIKNYSPWVDLLIVMRTIRTVLTGFGSR